MSSHAGGGLIQIGTTTRHAASAGLSAAERSRYERRARLLAWGGIAWHVVEFLIAVLAGIAAGSIALIGFGADSLIEAIAALVVIWLFTGSRIGSSHAERRAQQYPVRESFVIKRVNSRANTNACGPAEVTGKPA